MPKYSEEEFRRIVSERKPNLEIPFVPPKSEIPTKTICKICGYESMQTKREILHMHGKCPVCDNKVVVQGINDMLTTAPEVAKYFDYEFASTHTKGSSIKGLGTCPICGYQKMITPDQIFRQGFGCNCCSDGVSYPNKIGRSILRQFPISNLVCEYRPDWVEDKIFYDNYFEYNNNKYILEMDGGLGHGYSNYYHQEDIIGKDKDLRKDQLANEHGITVIRIDCLKSDLEYIKNNVLNNEILNSIFDLSQVNWEKCQKDATKSLIYEVCKFFNDPSHNLMMLSEIGEVFGISKSCVSNYLKRGSELGFCVYDRHLIALRSGRIKSKSSGTPLYIYNENYEFIEAAWSSGHAASLMNEKYPELGFNQSAINSSVRKNRPYKGFIFRKEKIA